MPDKLKRILMLLVLDAYNLSGLSATEFTKKQDNLAAEAQKEIFKDWEKEVEGDMVQLSQTDIHQRTRKWCGLED